MKKMKRAKNDLKQKQIEEEKFNFEEADKLNSKHQHKAGTTNKDNELEYAQTEKNYEEKLAKMK